MNQENNEINPAWKPLLDALPEALHALAIPHLNKWDQNFQAEVQKKVEEAVAPYQPYKVLVDNQVPMERIDETLRFVYTLENEPEQTVKNLAEHFKVEFAPAAPSGDSGNDDDPFNLGEDNDMKIEDHPVVKDLLERSQKLQQQFEEQEQANSEAQALTQFNKEIDDFLASKEDYKVIPKELLIAYMSQGASTEEAAEKIVGLVKTQVTIPGSEQEQQIPPTIMGGDGAAGSGLPNQALDTGAMSKPETTDLVVKMLEAAAQQNAQGG